MKKLSHQDGHHKSHGNHKNHKNRKERGDAVKKSLLVFMKCVSL